LIPSANWSSDKLANLYD
jgi:hypothetical protein